MVNLIIYKSEPGILEKIRAANAVSDFLATQGFPARRTADERIVRLHGSRATTYACLYAYLPGTTIPWEAYTRKHIILLGKTLSDMHHALYSFPASVGAALPDCAHEYMHHVERVRAYFSDTEKSEAIARTLGIHIPPSAIDAAARAARAASLLSRKQALHMDFVRGNILFSEGDTVAIAGVLDFEKTAYGHPILDIARTLAFLLVDCAYASEQKIRKHFLRSGYRKRGAYPLPHPTFTYHGYTYAMLEELIDLFLLYDLYKFLKHNPYESLHENTHYLRTREILLRRCRILEV
jgi:Ser/Thr protein kinase RdoA (MazF antagonist)